MPRSRDGRLREQARGHPAPRGSPRARHAVPRAWSLLNVLLYDGDCGFCSRGVLFSYRRDPSGKLRFASLQSEVGARLLQEHGLPLDVTTVVLIDGKGAHVRSTAVLRTARLLRWPWSWAYAAVLLPRPLRDAAYRLVAKHRHRLGPAVDACAAPTPELRARMLDRLR